MYTIDTDEKLGDWLADQAPQWSAAIAIRCALRVLPIALDPLSWRFGTPDPAFSASLWRAVLISTAAGNIDRDYENYAYTACQSASAAVSASVDASSSKTESAAYAQAYDVAHSVNHAARAASNSSGSKAAAAECAFNAAFRYLEAIGGGPQFFSPVTADVATLTAISVLPRGEKAKTGAMTLMAMPLWPDGVPSFLSESWERASAYMSDASEANWLWIDWYERRLRGEPKGFGLPSEYETDINRRLVMADDKWWDREPASITADIGAIIAELATVGASASDRIDTGPKVVGDLLPDPQSDTAPQFIEDAQGRFAIDPHANSDALLTDERAAERYAAARRRAQTVSERLRGHNQADYLAGYARELFEALGDDIPGGNLAETVLLANRIRQAAEAHAAAGPADDLQPLSPEIARPLSDLVDAVNLHIGQQPVLAAMDIAVLGPDAEVTASPDDVAVLLDDPDLVATFEPRTRDYIDATAKLAPQVPDASNRQSRRLGALTANLGRKVVQWANDHRVEIGAVAAVVVGGAAAMGSGFVAAAAVGLGGGLIAASGTLTYGGWNLLCNMKKHPREWMNLAGPSPASRANMKRLLGWLEDHLPADSGRDRGKKND